MSSPILYLRRMLVASLEWPASSKSRVASLPASSRTRLAPPGCYETDIFIMLDRWEMIHQPVEVHCSKYATPKSAMIFDR